MPQAPTRRRSDRGQETGGSNGATVIQATLQRVALLTALLRPPFLTFDAAYPNREPEPVSDRCALRSNSLCDCQPPSAPLYHPIKVAALRALHHAEPLRLGRVPFYFRW